MARKGLRNGRRGLPADLAETIVPLMPLHPKPVVYTVSGGGGQKDSANPPPPFDGLPWGWWQARTTLLSGLCKVTTAWHMAMVLYAAMPSPFGEFQCSKPLQNGSTMVGVADWLLSDAFWQWTWDPWVPCEEGIVIPFNATAPSPPQEQCMNWLELPTVNKWAGGCHRQFISGSSQFCYLVGIAAGGAICMRLLRDHSPRTVLLAALTAEACLALLLAGVQVFWAHSTVRFFLAIASSHLFTAAATLSADVCTGRARVLTLSLYEIWWSIGIIAISVFGSYAPNWTCLQALVSLPSFALILPCALLLPESPRWLVQRGRVEEAVVLWERAAGVNGQRQELPGQAALRARLEQHAAAARAQRRAERSAWSFPELEAQGSAAGPSRCHHLAKLAAAHLLFGCVTNTFFGSILNVRNWGTPGMLGLSVGEATAGVSGIAGFLLGTALLTRCRRPVLWLGVVLVACGFAGQLAHLVGPDGPDGQTVPRAVQVTLCALVERVAVALALPTIINCVPPLFPAPQRPSLIFSCVLFGRICLLAAPFVGNLVVYGEALPLTAFGLQLVLAGLSALVLEILQTNERRAVPKDFSG
ncbi:Organic cation transporter protein [Frankliniella fusca]|uniref:Organic cation transporter protein n=1 Tax=Frankliniella fusca TaxID=407009 RepID=A0AAE1LTC0_9NEOP|nr:Organic cation transporter protein [Frankliniella fusca]